MSLATERNRNRRRDKKRQRRKTGMRSDDSARRLALLKERKIAEGWNKYGAW